MPSRLRVNHLCSQFLLLLCVATALSVQHARPTALPDDVTRKRQTTRAPSPLVDFQVYAPILTPSGNANQYGCIHDQLLMDHVFAFSYGKPFVG